MLCLLSKCLLCLLSKYLPSHVFLCNRIALPCLAPSAPMQLRPYACFVCLLNASRDVFLKFMRRREARDDGTEPQDSVGGRIQKIEGPAGATADGRKCPRPC